MKKILLIDANLLLFRSFYAAYAISKEVNNLPCHLFFNTFIEIYKYEKPDFVFFAFDDKGKTWRHNEFTEYKAGRMKAPTELHKQKDIIREILTLMKLNNFSIVGDEADDLIATISEKYKNDNEILIFSEDKDLLQLVDKNVCVIQKNKNKNINAKYTKINNDNFFEMFQFLPNQVIDYKGIAGDNSDNLIGIKGIGPKTTIELLSKYKNLENIYNHLDELTDKQKKAFIEHKDQSFLCKKLATLNKSVNMNLDLNNLMVNINEFKTNNVFKVLEKYQLKKLISIIEKM